MEVKTSETFRHIAVGDRKQARLLRHLTRMVHSTLAALVPDNPLALLTRSAGGIVRSAIQHLPAVVAGIAVFLLFILIAKLVRWAIVRASHASARANLGTVIGRLAFFGLSLLGALIAFTVMMPSMTPGKLVSMLGIGGVAIGFAFKDIFQNMLAGVLLLWRQPFRIGDEITAGAFTGTVEAIETRATFLRTYDGKRIIIPNSEIYTESVAVITAYNLLRSEYDIGIGYGDDVEKAKSIVVEIFESTEGILKDPKPDVLVWDLAGSSLNLRARWWSKPDRASVVHLRDKVLQQVRERFPAAGIDLPFPTNVILFHDQTEERRRRPCQAAGRLASTRQRATTVYWTSSLTRLRATAATRRLRAFWLRGPRHGQPVGHAVAPCPPFSHPPRRWLPRRDPSA